MNLTMFKRETTVLQPITLGDQLVWLAKHGDVHLEYDGWFGPKHWNARLNAGTHEARTTYRTQEKHPDPLSAASELVDIVKKAMK